ncbi:MAG: VOC family protein [Pyrinomonadaceae bacterium]|nr:VOC family protein [Pyrinomonadaceae bacterium]
MKTHIILYVADQTRSSEFYSTVLGAEPTLNVPGMTEFELGSDTVLGLMPEAGAMRMFGDTIDVPPPAGRSPRAELYLLMDHPENYHERAIAAGGRELSAVQDRDWGHAVGYTIDPDGYVIAFARQINEA